MNALEVDILRCGISKKPEMDGRGGGCEGPVQRTIKKRGRALGIRQWRDEASKIAAAIRIYMHGDFAKMQVVNQSVIQTKQTTLCAKGPQCTLVPDRSVN